jgi:FlaA1/EpsC-like NDP-sugar epimerase
VITGVRPGEKMAEDIVAPDEEQLPSGHPAIVMSRPPVPDRAVVHRTLAQLEYLSFEGPPAELASRMKQIAADSMDPAPTARDSAAV